MACALVEHAVGRMQALAQGNSIVYRWVLEFKLWNARGSGTHGQRDWGHCAFFMRSGAFFNPCVLGRPFQRIADPRDVPGQAFYAPGVRFWKGRRREVECEPF